MKRCPQCEFIYEDDQSLCDMDGVLLVLDSRTLPNLHALATVPAKTQLRRNRAVPAFATLILALVLGMVYYVSTGRHISAPATVTSASNAAPVSDATPAAKPVELHTEEAKPAAAKKPVPKTVSAAKPKPSPEPKKDESKVGSLLKKTGRILKKPFKF